jgi:hypothetical protein
MNARDFTNLNREEQLAALKFLADRDGVDSPLYYSLACQHEFLCNKDNGIEAWRRPSKETTHD